MNILKKSVFNIKTLVVYFKTIFSRPSEKKEFAFLGRITHVPLRDLDLKEVPAIPIAHSEDILEMLLKLKHRVQEMQDAIQGLSETFTIGDETATAKEFLFGKASSLISLSEDSDIAQEAVVEEKLYWDHARGYRRGIIPPGVQSAYDMTVPLDERPLPPRPERPAFVDSVGAAVQS